VSKPLLLLVMQVTADIQAQSTLSPLLAPFPHGTL
jgi:hypothetical protein